MTPNPHFLCFPDKATAEAVLGRELPDGKDDPSNFNLTPNLFVVPVGALEREDGTFSDGYHVDVNAAEPLPTYLTPYEVFPENPRREFA